MAIAKIADYPMPDIKGQIVNKVKWNIKKEDAILLIHDMQIYFTDAYDKSGSLYRTLVENIRNIRLECKKYNIPVVYSAQPEGQTLEQRGLLYDFWGNILMMINKTCSVKDDMVMNVVFINMGADHIFIFSF